MQEGQKSKSLNIIPSIFLCIATAVLIILSFPKVDFGFLAWFALIPFFIALEGKTMKQAFWLGFLTGYLVFAGTLHWLFHITQWFGVIAGIGILFLYSYLALYYAAFAVGYVYFAKRTIVWKLILIPSLWTALEFIRAHLFSGFDWVSLGYSQYRDFEINLIAAYTGVLGVSFCIVFVASVLSWLYKRWPRCVVVFCMLCSFYLYIEYLPWTRKITPMEKHTLILQPNIDQDRKFSQVESESILDDHIAQTKQAMEKGTDQLAFIIWPETAFTAFVGLDDELFFRLKDFVREVQTPLLFGAVEYVDGKYYNAAILLNKDGEVEQKYHKNHLVPFGEYIPLPFIGEYLGIGNFTAGKEKTLFTYPGFEHKFGVLICFEDAAANVARAFVKKGANILVNITNDGWFSDSPAAEMHLQSSVFRAIENGVAIIRVANTGVSGMVMPSGRTTRIVSDTIGNRVKVVGSQHVYPQFRTDLTFYTKYGDIFTYICFACILGGILTQQRRGRATQLND